MRCRLVGSLSGLALSILLWPLVTGAQYVGKISRIGVLLPGSSSEPSPCREAFRRALHDLGYMEGQHIGFEWRLAERQWPRFPDLARELVSLNVDVIFALGRPAIHAAQNATTTLPIVMLLTNADPVETGFVKSLAHPGGNITGLTAMERELSEKRLALLKEVVPEVPRIAVLGPTPGLAFHWPELQRGAQALGVHLQRVEASGSLEHDLEAAVRQGAGGLIVLPATVYGTDARRIAELAIQNRLPAMFWNREGVDVGGLMAYGPSWSDLCRHAATYVDKLLKGAKPADLPVEQPTKFELVINLTTAQALGITIPPSLLFQADEVIK